MTLKFINSLLKNFQIVAKSFKLNEIPDDLEIKYVIKRFKKEYLLYFYKNQLHSYPNEEIFWKLFDSSDFKETIKDSNSYILSIDSYNALNIIGIVENTKLVQEKFNLESLNLQFTSVNEIKQQMKIYDPICFGYLIIDKSMNYYSLENPVDSYSIHLDYLNELTDHNIEIILEILRFHSNHDEILKVFKNTELFESFSILSKMYLKFCQKINVEFSLVSHLQTPKEFSIKVSSSKLKNELIGMYVSKSLSLEDYWERIPISKLKSYFKKELKKIQK
jgi:hypothetical protein